MAGNILGAEVIAAARRVVERRFGTRLADETVRLGVATAERLLARWTLERKGEPDLAFVRARLGSGEVAGEVFALAAADAATKAAQAGRTA